MSRSRRSRATPAGRLGWEFAIVPAFIGFVAVLVAGFLVLAAVSGTGKDPGTEGSAVGGDGLVVAGEFFYTPARVTSGPEVFLRLRNDGATYHDLKIEGVDGFGLVAHPGDEDEGTVHLEPGRYLLYCSIPGHREAGMVAELTVS
jgi:plastocyanin